MSNNTNTPNSVRVLNLIITVLLIITAMLSIVALFIIPNFDKISEIFMPLPELDSSKDFITVFDSGEADSILICSNGQKVLIDSGSEQFDNELCSKIRNKGIKELEAVFVSHLHDDHVGGLEKVAKEFKISNLIVPDLASNEESAFSVRKVKNDILNSGGNVFNAVAGMVTKCGDFEITILGYYSGQSSENNRSIFMMAKYNDFKFLFTGDAEAAAEKQLIREGINFDCDILKVAHHGSDTSTTEEFLKIATPEYAVISCGKDNEYNHPSSVVLDRLSAVGADVKRTDLQGDITFHFNSNELNVSVERLIEN
ncbi:MAG: MBL fold metallo-hydrolase [Ruminococcaceae bacterium]|nr:MBL fold metallo-hydrolase [Oscillospiraceae bacterium]